MAEKAELRLRGRHPWCPPARAPRGPNAGVRARGAEPWAGGAGGRSGGRAGRQARGRSRRQVRPQRAGPGAGGGARGFIVYGAGPARIFRPFLHSSAAPQPPPLPELGLAGSRAGSGRGAGGRRFKMEMRAGAGREGADVQRPQAARPARRPSPGSAAEAAGARPGGQAEVPGWIAAARTGASGGAGLAARLNPTPTLPLHSGAWPAKPNMGHLSPVYLEL